LVNASDDLAPLVMPWISTVFGVDFSGAALSGKTAWLARLDVLPGETKLRLVDVKPLGLLAGDDAREAVCGYLADKIRGSDQTFWGMDFPFGLPIELELGDWPDQLEHVAEFVGNAKDYGRHLVDRTLQRSGSMHIRRRTDRETKTPFDCYHYRIIYQTFHGMRDVLRPIADDVETAILPFQYERLGACRRIVVEACPSSTLKRLGLPHQRYKQSAGKPVEDVHVQTRRKILRGVKDLVEISPHRRRVLMADSGGDALDAVLAAVGSWYAVRRIDHESFAGDDRYPREGTVYA